MLKGPSARADSSASWLSSRLGLFGMRTVDASPMRLSPPRRLRLDHEVVGAPQEHAGLRRRSYRSNPLPASGHCIIEQIRQDKADDMRCGRKNGGPNTLNTALDPVQARREPDPVAACFGSQSPQEADETSRLSYGNRPQSYFSLRATQ
jgi:hypothetical protein